MSAPLSAPTPADYRVRVRICEVRFSLVREPGAAYDPRLLAGPAESVALAREVIPDDAREHFVAFYLNAQLRLLFWHEVSVGTLSGTLVHPREVFGPALRALGVASIVLAHNHPSGDPTPSREDVRLTRQLVEVGRVVDIPIHDHVVIGDGTDAYVSFAERSLL